MGLWVRTGGFKARKQVQYLLEQIGFYPHVQLYGYKKSKPPPFPVCDSNLASSAAGELQLFPKAESK